MKKITILTLLLCVVILVSACKASNTNQIRPQLVETSDFDIETAIEMVKEKEQLILDLSLRESISKEEHDRFLQLFTDEFGSRGDIMSIFLMNDMDNANPQTYKINKNTFYPTLFHKGIEVTEAKVRKTIYAEEYAFFNETRLDIQVRYSGEDEHLKSWHKTYSFLLDASGDWSFNGFGGTLNFMGQEYSMHYLELEI